MDEKLLAVLIAQPDSITLIRSLLNGDKDLSFGSGGIKKVYIGFIQRPRISTVKTDDLDRIILAGGKSEVDREDFLIIRLLETGDIDISFAMEGISITNPGASTFSYDKTKDFIVTPDNEIIICGYLDIDGSNLRLAVGKFDNTGSLDFTFGSNGFINSGEISRTETFQSNVVFLQNDSKIILS